MARQPMVTRTIKTTEITALCMDIEQREPCNRTVTIPGTFKNETDALKAAKKAINTDTIQAVAIVHMEVTESLYGIPESDFISLAKILPPRSTKSDEPINHTTEG